MMMATMMVTKITKAEAYERRTETIGIGIPTIGVVTAVGIIVIAIVVIKRSWMRSPGVTMSATAHHFAPSQ
jgi:hypothetical protein